MVECPLPECVERPPCLCFYVPVLCACSCYAPVLVGFCACVLAGALIWSLCACASICTYVLEIVRLCASQRSWLGQLVISRVMRPRVLKRCWRPFKLRKSRHARARAIAAYRAQGRSILPQTLFPTRLSSSATRLFWTCSLLGSVNHGCAGPVICTPLRD